MTKSDKKTNRNIFSFCTSTIIFILLLIVISKILFGYNLFYYFLNKICIGNACSGNLSFTCNLIKLNISFFSKIISFVFICCYIFYYFWIRKNVEGYRKCVYPVMYLLLLLITDFCYLSFVDLINNDSIFTTVNILNPFNIVHGILLGILIMIGNMKDNKKLKIKHSKYYNIITLLLTVIIVVVMQILIYLMILFSNVYNTCI